MEMGHQNTLRILITTDVCLSSELEAMEQQHDVEDPLCEARIARRRVTLRSLAGDLWTVEQGM